MYRGDNLGKNQINADIFAQDFNGFSMFLTQYFLWYILPIIQRRQVIFFESEKDPNIHIANSYGR